MGAAIADDETAWSDYDSQPGPVLLRASRRQCGVVVADVACAGGGYRAVRPIVDDAWTLRLMRVGMRLAPGPATRMTAADLPPPDRAAIDDPRARAAFVAMLRDGLRGGPAGTVLDGCIARGPWPLGAHDVRCPVDVYGGGCDRNVPFRKLSIGCCWGWS
ncbi:MAG: hypothetical protein WD336_06240 [Trueperaceae bacterium]